MKVFVGKSYSGLNTKESSEVDASIEAPGLLVFIEAKLYSSVSPGGTEEKPHDQIARKLRVGLDHVNGDGRDFIFIFLDIAPVEIMNEKRRKSEATGKSGSGYKDKWRSAWLFDYYKKGRNNSLRLSKKLL